VELSSNDYCPNQLFSLHGKAALITGGAGGLGKAIAAAYLRAGARVAIADLRKPELEAARAELSALGEVSAHECDVTQVASVEAAVAGAIADLGKINILFAAAGMARRNSAVDLPVEEFDLVMDVNVKGTWLSAQAVGRHMIERGEGGKIVTIGSVRGLQGHPLGYVAYGTSKGAVHLLTRQLATEWAKHRINVNCIAPSVLKTPLADFILKTPEVRDLFMSRIPLNRAAEPEEVSGTAIFLAASASDFITGQILFFDGGSTAG
jgi:NAD(P)-dependent dehydrogenase (short-subunit alcohol dehydrogenase family)